MKAGDIAEVVVDALTLEGEAIGRVAGRELTFRGAFPGERAAVRIEALSRQHARAYGRLLAIATPHPARRPAPCANHARREGRCTGCALMELDEPAQRDAKCLMLRERFGLEVSAFYPAPEALGYRYSSKRIAFSSQAQKPGPLSLGSFVHGTHTPAAMPGCLVDHPRLVHAFAELEEAARALGIAAYDERSGRGDLRYVWGKTNGREVILTLVSAGADTRVRELASPLRERVAGVLHSVQPALGNALRGARAELLFGRPELSLELLGQKLEVGALGFLQPNPEVAEQAYRALIGLDAFAGRRRLAFDLYAGAGITARALCESFAEVVAVEANPESARALMAAPETVESFLARALADEPRRVPDLVIANPPRKGLGAGVCDALSALASPALRIMSCGPAGLARDLRALGARYELRSLEAFDTLPQTPHVELVATLVRRP